MSVQVHPGDLIVSNSATPGIPKFLTIDACIHDGWLLLRDIEDTTTKEYLYYLLVSIREGLLQLGNGSIFTNLKTDILKNYPVKIPNKELQKMIVSVLSLIDDKIDLLVQQNTTIENLAESIFSHRFNQYKDDSNLSVLSKEFSFIMGQSPSGETINENGSGMPFFQGRSDFGFRFPTTRTYTTDPKRIAPKYSTLISVRAPIGDMNIATESCSLGRGVAAFYYKENENLYSYTYYKLKSLRPEICKFEDVGTIFGSIGKSDFENIPSEILPIQIVEKINSELKIFDEKILLNDFHIRTLRKTKELLLPKLLNGEIELK